MNLNIFNSVLCCHLFFCFSRSFISLLQNLILKKKFLPSKLQQKILWLQNFQLQKIRAFLINLKNQSYLFVILFCRGLFLRDLASNSVKCIVSFRSSFFLFLWEDSFVRSGRFPRNFWWEYWITLDVMSLVCLVKRGIKALEPKLIRCC